MTSDALLLIARINLAGAAAVCVVMALRAPVRRLFGAGAAYGLWTLAPLAALAMILPGRVVTLTQAPSSVAASSAAWSEAFAAPAPLLPAGPGWPAVLAGLWIAGVLASFAGLAWQQTRFGHAMRAGRGGPAVLGVLKPRIVTPADFASRYTPREQMVVLAHERTHLARHDSRINAAVALVRCALWFNPFVHLLARYLRIDQELACDAAVVAAFPHARRAYAEALLKTQLAGRPLPLGCYWPAQAAHPLAQRIGLLTLGPPRWPGARLGTGAVALLALAGAWTAWATRPAEIVFAPAPPIATATSPAATRLAAAPAIDPPRPAPSAATPARAGRPAMKPLALAAIDPGPPPAPAAEPDPPFPTEQPRLLPAGLFGPPRRVSMIADWSSVEPGSAVRVIATMTDPDGVPLTTDLTAFGSQSWYRLGYISRGPSRYKLFTKVTQHGERMTVTAGLDRSFRSLVSGSVELASGETGTIRLPSGQLITVTPILRPETPQELAAAHGRPFVNIERVETL
jgi:beta-lactamase regulating signal transducer with metallopeptidase domain